MASTSSVTPTEKLTFPVVRPLATQVLLVVNVALFLLTYLYQQSSPVWTDNPVLNFGVLDYSQIVHNGEWYRLFTSMFLHLDFAHILFNGYALWVLGQDMESIYGHTRFLIIYFLAGFGGALASWIIGQGASLGASGAIFGLVGAEIAFLYYHRSVIGNYANTRLRQMGLYIVLTLGLGVASGFGTGVRIDNWGHIGGLLGGLIVAAAIAPQYGIGEDATGKPIVVDQRPFRARWPLAAFIAAVEVGIGVVAYLTLPR
jgi:rhomboid protease GluP